MGPVQLTGARMGFRFRKRVKLLPGVWLNLGKSGISTSIGTKGMTVNLKGDAIRTTVSAPGTGISYTSTAKGSDDTPSAGPGAAFVLLLVLAAAAMVYFAAQ